MQSKCHVHGSISLTSSSFGFYFVYPGDKYLVIVKKYFQNCIFLCSTPCTVQPRPGPVPGDLRVSLWWQLLLSSLLLMNMRVRLSSETLSCPSGLWFVRDTSKPYLLDHVLDERGVLGEVHTAQLSLFCSWSWSPGGRYGCWWPQSSTSAKV